jgi:hypothetical protein
MSLAEFSVMADFRQGRPRDRLRAFLSAVYGHGGEGRDKRLARDLSTAAGRNVTERAARNLFAGHWPGDDTWAAIVRRFGTDVLRVVFAPEIDPVLAELQEREARLERELQAIQARRRAVAGAVEPRTFVLAGDQDQADPLDGPPNLDLFGEARP